MDREIEQRFVELEMQVAQNQETIDELNGMVRRLWDGLETLRAEVKVLGHEILVEAEGETEPRGKPGA